MNILDGKKMGQVLLAQLKERVVQLGFVPVFVDVLVGEDPVSLQYIGMKEKRAKDIGIAVHRVKISGDATTDEVIEHIQKALKQDHICGSIVQLPLPRHIDTQKVLDAIPADIDVDVLGEQTGKDFYNNTSLLSFPAAKASFELLQMAPHDVASAKVLVIGQGMLVGKPVTHMLRNAGYTVTTANRTVPLTNKMLQKADIIISATGVPNLITKENLKVGVVIIDAGTSESSGGVVGDVNVNEVQDIASYIAPVPGGVGPLTVAILLDNIVTVAEQKQHGRA